MTADEIDTTVLAAAKSVDGLTAARIGYLQLLRLPFGQHRFQSQIAMCELRDFIARAAGIESLWVQNAYEAIARGMGEGAT